MEKKKRNDSAKHSESVVCLGGCVPAFIAHRFVAENISIPTETSTLFPLIPLLPSLSLSITLSFVYTQSIDLLLHIHYHNLSLLYARVINLYKTCAEKTILVNCRRSKKITSYMEIVWVCIEGEGLVFLRHVELNIIDFIKCNFLLL